MPEIDYGYEAQKSLDRIRPVVLARISECHSSRFTTEEMEETIEARFAEHWERLFILLFRLYGHHYDFFFYLQQITLTAIDSWLARPDELHQLDLRRENDPTWYLSERMTGGSLYVDLFSGDLQTLRNRVPYFKDLGLTYLHLMPLFASREGNSDGGYAISDYRTVDPKLGTIEDLRALAADLREANISLVLDFVFNHTSDDHEWAIRAQEGDRHHLDFYHTYDDRFIPDQYEQTLREIFPTVRRGNFTWHESLKKWVWTTFNSFQWDLRYANPAVFQAMAGEMLFLANTGVEILRLDAVAFIWKQMGTTCENLPEAHLIIQAFNALCRLAAPSLIFKSEAIVHPDDVVKYISEEECQLSYNPTMMALIWESIATRQTTLLRKSLSHRHHLPQCTAWINYLRGHDDIGWSFDNGDAWSVGIDPDGHRNFLNQFYTGRFEGSFATGVPFQHNERTGDMRICGTMASLAGLEQALEEDDPELLNLALARITMLYGILSSIGGIPLIFVGEEWGMLNDYSYLQNPDKEDDSRWIHRPPSTALIPIEFNRENAARQAIFTNLQTIFAARKNHLALRGSEMNLIHLPNDHLLCYHRHDGGNSLVALAHFSEFPTETSLFPIRSEGLGHFMKDVFTGKVFSTNDTHQLSPYQLLWLISD